MAELPKRQRLYHDVPEWVKSGALFFVTVCAAERGVNSLATERVGPGLLASVEHYRTIGVWWVRLFLVMPDHVHALLAVAPDRHLGATVVAWKSYQSKALGVTWQSGFFDHRIRHDESLDEKAEYIRQNPVRAGLVATSAAWPNRWEPKG